MKPFFDTMERATKLSAALHQDLSEGSAEAARALFALDFRRYQNEATLKKVEVEGDLEGLQKQAFSDFLHRNLELASVNHLLATSEPDDTSVLGFILRRARHVIGGLLGDISTDEIYYACRHSTGVTQGVPFYDTSLNSKSRFPWSVTERLSSFLPAYDGYDKLYSDACFQVSLEKSNRFEVVLGSRATTVPKTASKRRMIAIEPTGNMYFQQGLMHIMYDRLRKGGLDVNTLPDRHRDLAFWSSVSGFEATIDLSNASDTVALELVRYLFPAKWFWWLNLTRSPSMSVDGKWVPLQAYATMGNATTFPVETLVFWALGVGSMMLSRQSRLYGRCPWKYQSLLSHPCDRRLSVFGDDIIIPNHAAPNLVYVLGQLGFSLNREKSFFDQGPSFRESCGGDFFHGRAMRPFYIKGPTTTSRAGLEAWIYVMANTLQSKYISYFGRIGYIYEKKAYKLMLQWLLAITPFVKVVPSTFPDDSGLKGLEGLRLARAYVPADRIGEIGRSEQGWYTFKYLRYTYPRVTQIAEALTYAVWIKNQATNEKEYHRKWHSYLPPERDRENFSPIRKKGYYVVARGSSKTF